MVNKKRLIEIPDDGIIKIPIMQGNSTVGERIIDLSHLPTVDAVEVVHGRWDYSGNCSACGKNIYNDIDADMWSRYAPPYCPNCGAKMDKEA